MMRHLGLAAYGAGLGLAYVVMMQKFDGAQFAEPDIVAGFALASAAAAWFAGLHARRIPSSLRLMGIAAVLGAGVAIAAATKPRGPALALVLALVGAPLVALRLALDLFAPRWSPLARRVVAMAAFPLSIWCFIQAVHLSRGPAYHMPDRDRVFIVMMAVLAPAIVPPRRLEESEP